MGSMIEMDSTWKENFSLRLSDESDESINFDITQEVNKVSEKMGLTDRSNLSYCGLSDVDEDNKREIKDADESDSKADLSGEIIYDDEKPLKLHTNVKVVLEILPESTIRKYIKHSTADKENSISSNEANEINDHDVPQNAKKVEDEFVKNKDLISHYCTQCNIVIKEKTSVSKARSCEKCETAIQFQCDRCKATYKCYSSLIYHFNTKCNVREKYECSNCFYQTTVKHLLDKHQKHCEKKVGKSLSKSTKLKNEKKTESKSTINNEKSAESHANVLRSNLCNKKISKIDKIATHKKTCK